MLIHVRRPGVGKTALLQRLEASAAPLPVMAPIPRTRAAEPPRLPRLPSCLPPTSESTRHSDIEKMDHVMLPYKLGDRSVHLKLYEDVSDIPDSIDRVDGVGVVFAVNDRASFWACHMWVDVIKRFAQKNIDIVLVATKVDLEDERKVTHSEALSLAGELEIELRLSLIHI
eukprot:TRINITY_DN23384_c0_g2_i1.p1 TRINITY_DN23384_c0_g2~~TRINITY_DN23384_c0_g2_i1.p1  ORF type:complete len:171 (-),score=10.68 TRINITY_DN23384_c0_g2_i1:176-688(-)